MDLEEVKRYVKIHGLDRKTNKRVIVYQRFHLYKYMRDVLNLKYREITEVFNRNHSTVIKGYQAYGNLLLTGGYSLKEFRDITEDVRYYFPVNKKAPVNTTERLSLMFKTLANQNKLVD